jgi:hypothetical protein
VLAVNVKGFSVSKPLNTQFLKGLIKVIIEGIFYPFYFFSLSHNDTRQGGTHITSKRYITTPRKQARRASQSTGRKKTHVKRR